MDGNVVVSLGVIIVLSYYLYVYPLKQGVVCEFRTERDYCLPDTSE